MCKGIEFLAFQEKINSLLKKGKVKDYYNVIGGLLNTKKTILEVNEIETQTTQTLSSVIQN